MGNGPRQEDSDRGGRFGGGGGGGGYGRRDDRGDPPCLETGNSGEGISLADDRGGRFGGGGGDRRDSRFGRHFFLVRKFVYEAGYRDNKLRGGAGRDLFDPAQFRAQWADYRSK